MKSKHFSLIHKEMEEDEAYEAVKRLHKSNPEVFMNPEKWKRLRKKGKK